MPAPDLRFLYTLADGTGREVYRDTHTGVLHVRSAAAVTGREAVDLGSDAYKRAYTRFVEGYRKPSLLGRLRDVFHSMQAGLFVDRPGVWRRRLVGLVIPVPREVRGHGRFLDVGCNTGSILSRLPAGWERYGVEISAEAAAAARAHPGVTVWEDAFERIDTPLRFDLIRACHVVEHIEDTDAFLAAIAAHLADGGGALFYTPNTDGVGLRAFGKHWNGYADLTHVRMFSLDNLSAQCARHGLTPVAGGTYYMGLFADSLLRALGVRPEGRAYHLGLLALALALYPASFVANWLRLGDACYLYVVKGSAPAESEAMRDLDATSASNPRAAVTPRATPEMTSPR